MKKITIIFVSILALALIFGGCQTAMGQASASEHEASPSADPAASPVFTDVSSDAWYAEAVDWCQRSGLMSGTSTTAFSPNSAMTRGMLVTVLYRAAGSPSLTEPPSYSDVSIHSWYAEGVAWASLHGIVSGYGNDSFGPEDPVSREQIAAILWRYDGSTPAQSTSSFTDRDTVSAYAVPAVDWAWENGILSGLPDGSVSPSSSATRAQVSVMLFRFLSGDGSEDGDSMFPNEILTTNSGEEIALSRLTHRTTDREAPEVFFISDISPEALIDAYNALEWTPSGNVAVKLSTGEPGSNYLRPELIADLVQLVDGTIVECNTAYGGSRASTAMHYQVAEDHGFTAIADVQIQDENGSMTLPVVGGTVLTENYVGAAFADYDSYLVLSHFKGHSMAGFGGAIKNISIGLGSSEGKAWIHSGGTGGSMWGGDQDAFLEAMGDAGKSVSDYLDNGKRIVYINVMNRLSVDCDCDGNPAEPDMHDIGILACADPVALDQACIDLVYATRDGASLIQRIESRNGLHTLENAQAIGLGSREYRLQQLQ